MSDDLNLAQHGGYGAAGLLLLSKIWNRLSVSTTLREVRETVARIETKVAEGEQRLSTIEVDVAKINGRMIERDSQWRYRD